MTNQVRVFIFALAALMASAASATDEQPSMFKLSGFATLAVSHSSERRADYVIDSTVPKGTGLSKAWSWDNDTRVGGQVSAAFTPHLSGVLQVISEYQYDSTYQPGVEWANLKYSITPDFYVRAGRIALPTFLNSDTRKVGYSYPWVHPPMELYRQLAITSSDGVDVMYRFNLGEASNSIRAVYGRNRLDRLTSVSTSKGMWGVFDTLEYGAVLFRAGFQERESSSLTRATGAVGAWVRNTDLSLGASYDPGNWFIMSEWIRRTSTTQRVAMYASAGYRMGKFTPYLTYSQDSHSSFLNAAAPTAAQITLAKRSQHTTSMGMRWDYMEKADVVLQYDTVQLGADSTGDMVNVPATLGTALNGARFHVFSAALDFLF